MIYTDKDIINESLLDAITESFRTYLDYDSSRSTAKLKSLHGHIAGDLANLYGDEYTIISQGYKGDREISINGRYYPKNVDITICKDGKPVAGYAVKFVMRNYSQNSNNYFENMLGETANIRANSIPYFQIFIVFEKVPYYKKGGQFSRYDIISQHNLNKYVALSNDDPAYFYHAPDKTLIVLLNLKEKSYNYMFSNSTEYANYYMSVIDDPDLITYSTKVEDVFGDSVILNDYCDFIKRTYFITEGRIK